MPENTTTAPAPELIDRATETFTKYPIDQAAEPESEFAGADPEPEPEAPREQTLDEQLVTDIRSMWAHKEPTAMLMVADLKEPHAIPEGTYRDAMSEAVSLRSNLRELGVNVATVPEDETERDMLHAYREALYTAHRLRAAV